jgi:hypothetical protein
MAFAPATPDLAAAEYRVELYHHIGVRLWDNFWYSGHHLPAYSVIYPPLAWLIGDRLLGVACAVLSSILFARIVHRHFGSQADWGARLFAFGSVAGLCIGQLTFSLGLCVGLAAVLAWQSSKGTLALVLAAATGLASPVAAAFLALAACAVFAGRDQRRDRAAAHALLMAAAALAIVVLLAVFFPEGGRQPFALQSLLPLLASTVLITLAFGQGEQVLRVGAIFYALAALASFVLSTPMGSNANRLGAAFALPLLACSPRRGRLLVLACAALFAWQWTGPVRDISLGSHDPTRHASFYAPLRDHLLAEHFTGAQGRVEIPFTRLHWEARYVAEDFPLARGWERQLDTKYDALFYHSGKHVDPGEYHAWLRQNAVRLVAVPDADLDQAGETEAKLIRGGLPFLRRIWQRGNWTVYEVRDALPLAGSGARIDDFGHNHIDGTASRAGWVMLRVRFTPYFQTRRGVITCIREAGDGWTKLYAQTPGEFSIRAKFSVSAAIKRKPACRL